MSESEEMESMEATPMINPDFVKKLREHPKIKARMAAVGKAMRESAELSRSRSGSPPPNSADAEALTRSGSPPVWQCQEQQIDQNNPITDSLKLVGVGVLLTLCVGGFIYFRFLSGGKGEETCEAHSE